MQILQANIPNWHAQEYESTSRKACRREVRQYIHTCDSVSEWARKSPAPTNSPVAQRWRMWEDKRVYVAFCSRHYISSPHPLPPISASMCAIFHAGDLTSGTENNVVATSLVRLDNASRTQVTRCPVDEPTSRAGMILEFPQSRAKTASPPNDSINELYSVFKPQSYYPSSVHLLGPLRDNPKTWVSGKCTQRTAFCSKNHYIC